MYGWLISVIFAACTAFGIQSSDICLELTYVCILDYMKHLSFTSISLSVIVPTLHPVQSNN